MMDRGAGCMGKPLVRFCEGQEFNCDMDQILWHRRESRRKQRKQTLSCSHGSLLSTRKPLGPIQESNRVIDAKHKFAKRRFHNHYLWKPTPDVKAAIEAAIFRQ
jgi:hypothetical protein